MSKNKNKTAIIIFLALIWSMVWPSYVSLSLEHSPEEIYLRNIANYNNQCTFYAGYFEERLGMPKGILKSISTAESSLRPWTINVAGKAHYFKSKAKAIKFIKAKLKKGVKSIDVGCMQINLKHHGEVFENLEAALDPKTNIAYAASFLMERYSSKFDWNIAIAHYHSRHQNPGKKYVDRVMKIWKKSGDFEGFSDGLLKVDASS